MVTYSVYIKKLRKVLYYLLNKPSIIVAHLFENLFWYLQDELYLKCLYFIRFQRIIDFKHPRTFTEKLQWLKLYDRKPEYTRMVDKKECKEYVSNIIGQKYVIPTLGVWERFEDIDFDKLPNQFVLKTTHGGGGAGVVICKDKSEFNISSAQKTLNTAFKQNIYRQLREWPYKNVKPRIMAEAYLSEAITPENPTGDIIDYKFYCFNGNTKAVAIATERHSKTGVCFDYFDEDFNHYPFEQGGPNSKKKIAKPKCFSEMWQMANKLSEGLPHVRVDLYCIRDQIYFGELTFFDASGFVKFKPKEWDYKFGEWIVLPEKTE